MQSSIMRNFKRAAVATAGLAMLTLSAPFNASAHVLPGSVLEESRGFINSMHHKTKDGYEQSCCHEKDGQGGLEEAKVVDPITGQIKYSVKLVNDESGVPLANPVWIDIPDEAVLIYKDAVEFCKNMRKNDPENPDAATCNIPKTNALWTSEIPHDVRILPDHQPPFSIYCYLPKPPKF